MKAGDEITCPHCGAESFLVRQAVMDGWTKVGEVLVCSACTAKIADLAKNPPTSGHDGEKGRESASKLVALLGADQEPEKPKLVAAEDEKRFCRDCAHLVQHPFLTRCDLHRKDVNPMDDCPDFTPKKRSGEKKL